MKNNTKIIIAAICISSIFLIAVFSLKRPNKALSTTRISAQEITIRKKDNDFIIKESKPVEKRVSPKASIENMPLQDESLSKAKNLLGIKTKEPYDDLPEIFTENEINRILVKAEAVSIWTAQDKVMRAWPIYDNIRDKLLKEVAQELDLSRISEEEIIRKALVLRNIFWQSGDGFSQTSYIYAYKARLLLELAHELNPKNMTITDELVETIQAAHPATMFEEETNKMVQKVDICETLLKLRSEQFKWIKNDIKQTRRNPTWYDFIRAVDCAVLLSIYDRPSAKEVVTWLQQNTERGGWDAYGNAFDAFQKALDQNKPFNFSIYVATKSKDGNAFRYGRRFPSFRGPNPEERGLVLWKRKSGELPLILTE